MYEVYFFASTAMKKPNFHFNRTQFVQKLIDLPKSIKIRGKNLMGFFTGRALMGHCKIIMRGMPIFLVNTIVSRNFKTFAHVCWTLQQWQGVWEKNGRNTNAKILLHILTKCFSSKFNRIMRQKLRHFEKNRMQLNVIWGNFREIEF
jgi:hypothetical protein